jgi:hypothetical protein
MMHTASPAVTAQGCGKTSYVSALAAELGATLYLLSLDARRMSDGGLKTLLRAMTAHRIVLLVEDVDAALPEAFNTARSGGSSAESGEAAETTTTPCKKNSSDNDDDSHDHDFGLDLLDGGSTGKPTQREGRAAPREEDEPLTLEGLLEALNGAGAPEGRILFLTTNHIERLPRALLQPGVVDAAVEFSLGTKEALAQLFTNFYLLQDETTMAMMPLLRKRWRWMLLTLHRRLRLRRGWRPRRAAACPRAWWRRWRRRLRSASSAACAAWRRCRGICWTSERTPPRRCSTWRASRSAGARRCPPPATRQ